MTGYAGLFLAGVLISAFSQILLKIEAKKEHKSWIYEYLNVRVIVAYILFFAATFVTIFCYKVLPLSIGALLDSCGYVFVTLLGYIILKEKVSKRKIVGIVLVLIGVLTASEFLI